MLGNPQAQGCFASPWPPGDDNYVRAAQALQQLIKISQPGGVAIDALSVEAVVHFIDDGAQGLGQADNVRLVIFAI
ncbi:hypothetical protein D3C78_1723810 [compost metagenome]